MDTSAPNSNKKLDFMRRWLWWLPVFVFAVFAAVSVSLNPLSGGSVMTAVTGGLFPAILVGVLCLGLYFGYKYMLSRNPNL